ncbi:MAG: DUF4105 domain-containing protein [Chitinophagaceae bacterium]
MKLLSKFIFLIFSFYSVQNISAQNVNVCHLRISVLTCAPGEELYATFGHSAIRIIDSTKGSDLIYNWGTFNFDDPDFYTKFIRGKLLYYLAVDTFNNFMYEYEQDQRSVLEQVLQLNCEEKINIYNAIQNNLQGNNRFYHYDFLYDNCTTRIRDILFKNIPHLSIEKNIIPAGVTSRDLIHVYVDKGGEPWTKLGMDILLGEKVDKPITNYAAMFVPDYLMLGIDKAETADKHTIVLQKRLVLQTNPPNNSTGKYVPLIVLSCICILLFAACNLQYNQRKNVSRIIDSFLLYVTGLLGVLILFMWFATDHTVCKNNYNIIWALPTNFIAAFFIWKRPIWIRRYFYIVFFIYALFIATWFWLPQKFNISIFPVLLLLLFRFAKLATEP